MSSSSGELDERDLRILELLARNARMPYSEIARRLGVSDVAVMKRVRRLEQLGVIKGYTVVVEPERMGYRLVSLTGIDVEPEHLFPTLERLRAFEGVRYIAVTSGDHSIMTVIWARDSAEMAEVHERISRLPGVRRVCPAVILDVVKGFLVSMPTD